MHDFLMQLLQVGFFEAIIRIATPLILGTLGVLFAERAGVLNLGVEGMMIFAAMAGFSAAYFSGNLWLGTLVAVCAGATLGLLLALMTVTLGLSQHVSGLGVTMLGSGLAYYIYRLVFGTPSQMPTIQPMQPVAIPLLSDLPFVGPVLFNQHLITYFAFVLVAIAAFALKRTPWGLSLRTVGENPRAADSAGVNVAAIRYQALAISGALAGLAGIFLSLAQFNAFTFGVISGRGWICVALVVFGQWQPWRTMLGALLFGLVDALQFRLQSSGIVAIPYQVFLMLPYLMTILAMAIVSRDARAPAALSLPFRREER